MPTSKNIIYLFRYLKNWLAFRDRDKIYKNPKSRTFKPNSIAIIFVHGLADKPGTFHDLIVNLIPHLPETVTTMISLSAVKHKKSIATFAERLVQKIKKYKHQHIILVGHSRGGIVCAYAAENLAVKNNITVHGVIAIGSPFKGSHLIPYAAAVLVKPLEELSRHGQLLRKLETLLLKNKYRHQYLFVIAEQDLLVDMASSCINMPLSKTVILNDLGHLSILQSPELRDTIRDAIKSWVASLSR